MKLGICGSPRDGNSVDLITKLGLDEIVFLKDLGIDSCRGCEACEDGSCILKDDMGGIIEKMIKADTLVFVYPSYFNNCPGIMKNFIDRTNQLWFSGKLKGKNAIIITVGGQEKDVVKMANFALEEYSNIMEMHVLHSLGYNDQGVDMDEIKSLLY